ncbi:flagellar basal body P-ring formation chaperone FlgA [Temperatibacter marinus]|uniref:Flagellar basal body P-ring formation chaperone FlgA n=1 Tax=Temperatibacter marinus TaxID=1456591 RepID=A0AA52EFN8_9PROT|nr:flagellar basal body P-ring formation chaperone FlgA [Temperatibacter marinus]WND01677.1 flagellar basal body P-ring formation chaperone FlgA [Temperatibacter marinus]
MFNYHVHIKTKLHQLALATGIISSGFMVTASTTYASTSDPSISVALAESIEIETSFVTLAQLFGEELTYTLEDPDKIIMKSPKPGQVKKVSSYELERIAKTNNVNWSKPDYTFRMTISRIGLELSQDDVQPLIDSAIHNEIGEENIRIQLFGFGQNIMIPTTRSLDEVQINNLKLNQRRDNFSLTLLIPEGENAFKQKRVNGRVDVMTKIPVLSAALLKGEVIRQEDITWKEVKNNSIRDRYIISDRELIGMSPVRTLRPNQPIQTSSIQRPQIIKKGDLISVTLKTGPLTISMTAKAMEDGARGETIIIQNTRSKKTFEAIVHGVNSVRVQPNRPLKLASR